MLGLRQQDLQFFLGHRGLRFGMGYFGDDGATLAQYDVLYLTVFVNDFYSVTRTMYHAAPNHKVTE